MCICQSLESNNSESLHVIMINEADENLQTFLKTSFVIYQWLLSFDWFLGNKRLQEMMGIMAEERKAHLFATDMRLVYFYIMSPEITHLSETCKIHVQILSCDDH